MIFRPVFEPDSCTYSYLLACPDTGVCAIIDAVIDTGERDLQVPQSGEIRGDHEWPESALSPNNGFRRAG